MRKSLLLAAAAVACALAFLLMPATSVFSQQIAEVLVGNFPDTQKVTGEVEIKGGLRQAVMVRREGEVVSPVGRHETQNLVAAGTVATDGYVAAVVSIQGDVRGRLLEGGTVGAVLVPDERPILRAFNDEGLIQLPLEVKAEVGPGESLSFSGQARVPIAFPRYRLYLYNTSAKSVEANVYVYLTQ